MTGEQDSLAGSKALRHKVAWLEAQVHHFLAVWLWENNLTPLGSFLLGKVAEICLDETLSLQHFRARHTSSPQL